MKNELTAMTFSKKAKAEIAKILPEAKTFTKRHVPGVGYVFFIKNATGVTIAKCFKESLKPMTLQVA